MTRASVYAAANANLSGAILDEVILQLDAWFAGYDDINPD